MDYISIEERIRATDWVRYMGPKYFRKDIHYFDPENLVNRLVELSQLDEPERIDLVAGAMRYAAGNDSRGTYYPAMAEAVNFIIEIERTSPFDAARRCAAGVLNDLFYFQLELEETDRELLAELDSQIRSKLGAYSDENSGGTSGS